MTTKKQLNERASYSAKAARAGKDIGKPGKAFAQIAKSAGERYGSKERGEKVAGAVLKKLRANESVHEDSMDESALQAHLGKKKYGPEGMKALQKAGREGASKEKMAKLRAKHDKLDEVDMEEGNEFSGELAKAKASGAKEFKVDGKTYPVKESKKSKPDYLDFDKDGDKSEPMKKALSDKGKKKVKEGAMRPLGKKASKNPNDNPLFRDYATKGDKGINKTFKNTFGDLSPVKKKDMKPTSVKESSYTTSDVDNPRQKPSAANKKYGDLKVADLKENNDDPKFKKFIKQTLNKKFDQSELNDSPDYSPKGNSKSVIYKDAKLGKVMKPKNSPLDLREDIKFQELDSMFQKFLAEEITISSTHNTGTQSDSSMFGGAPAPEDSVNVSARGEDAKELMKILRSAGLVDSGDMGDDDNSDSKGSDQPSQDHSDDSVMSAPGGTLSSDDYEDEGGDEMGEIGDSGISGTIEVIKPSDMSNSGSDVMKQLIAKMMGGNGSNGSESGHTHESTCNECGSMYEGESCMECGGMYEDQPVQEADMVGDFMNQISDETPATDSENETDPSMVTATDDGESSQEHDVDEFTRFLDLLRPIVGDVVDQKKDELKDIFDKVDDDAEDKGENVADELEDEAEENNSPESKEEEYDQEEYETTSESKEDDDEDEEEDEEEEDEEDVSEAMGDLGQPIEDAAAEKEGEAEAQAEKLDEREYGAALAKLRESAGLPSQSTEGLANGNDDTAVQDTEFMVNTISQGANQKKSTGIAIQPQNKKWPVNEGSTPFSSMRSILDKLTQLK